MPFICLKFIFFILPFSPYYFAQKTLIFWPDKLHIRTTWNHWAQHSFWFNTSRMWYRYLHLYYLHLYDSNPTISHITLWETLLFCYWNLHNIFKTSYSFTFCTFSINLWFFQLILLFDARILIYPWNFFFCFLQNSLTKRSKYKSIMKWVRLLQLFAEFNFILPDYHLQDYIKIFLFHTWMISKGNPIVFQAEPGLEQFLYHILINPVIWIHTLRLFAI